MVLVELSMVLKLVRMVAGSNGCNRWFAFSVVLLGVSLYSGTDVGLGRHSVLVPAKVSKIAGKFEHICLESNPRV